MLLRNRDAHIGICAQAGENDGIFLITLFRAERTAPAGFREEGAIQQALASGAEAEAAAVAFNDLAGIGHFTEHRAQSGAVIGGDAQGAGDLILGHGSGGRLGEQCQHLTGESGVGH